MVFRQTLHGVSLRIAFQELRSEGLFYLYRGVLPPFCQKTINMSLMYGIFEYVKKRCIIAHDMTPNAAVVTGAAVSGTLESLGMPFERLQTLLADPQYHKRFRNTFHAFRSLKSYGVKEYYRGYLSVLFKSGPSNMSYFIMKDKIFESMPEPTSPYQRNAYQFLSGALIGSMNSLVFYPFSVTRVATQSRLGGPYLNPLQVLRNVYRARGGKIRNIYCGILGNTARSFVSWGIINTVNEHCKMIILFYNQLSNTFDWREFACGCGAAVINVVITYPLNRLVFRQMLEGVKFTSAFTTLKNAGPAYFFRGMLAPLCQKMITVSMMFGIFEQVRKPLVSQGMHPDLARVFSAVAAGLTELAIMPFERVQTLLSDSRYDTRYRNTLHAFRKVGKYGIREYYRGYQATMMRNAPSNVPYFLLKDKLYILPRDDTPFYRRLNDFLCGGLIGFVNSYIFYPVNVSRVAIQSKLGEGIENPYKVLVQVYRDRGSKVRYIYRGAFVNSLRCFMGWGIVNVSYETLRMIYIFNK